MAEKKTTIDAVDIKRGTTIAQSSGGSYVARPGDVLITGRDLSAEDARYLVASGKAVPCDPKLKAARAKEDAEREKAQK
jgi:uncharacterized protein with PhoU and TrkA domain